MPRSSSSQRTQATGRISYRNMMASLSFNGTNTSVFATKIPNLQLGCTFSAWFKYKPGTPPACIIENSQDTNNRLVMMYQSGYLRAGYWNGSAYTFKNSSWVTPNTWYHGVFTWDGAITKLYLNGVEQLFTTQAPSSSQGGVMAIGMSGDGGGGRPFLGNIARAMLWNRPLTQAEVTSIYERGAVPSSGLVGKFDLNEGAGAIAYDTSGAGNNGTISNGVFTSDSAYWRRQPVNLNLVYNGDFEYAPVVSNPQTSGFTYIDGTSAGSSTNRLFGWGIPAWGGTYSAKFDNSDKNSGSYSMKLSTLATASRITVGLSNEGSGAIVIANSIPVRPSTSYTFTYWMKTSVVSGSATTGARAFLQSFTASGAANGSTSGSATAVNTTTGWTQYTQTIVTAASTFYISPKIDIMGTDGVGTLVMDAWFDDITLTPTTPTSRQVIS